MLRNRGPLLGLAFFLCLGGFSIYKTSTEPSKYRSYQTRTYDTDQKTTQNNPFNIFWEWSTHDAITFFTFVLSIFTGALVVVSFIQIRFLIRADKTARISADAAFLQARAAVAAELSEFLIGKIDLVPYPDAPPGQSDVIVAPGPLQQSEMRVVVTVKNLGRTRSRMNELCVEWLVVDRTSPNINPDPPLAPAYNNRLGISHIFANDELMSLKWSGETNSIIYITDEQRRAINANAAWLWIYGSIRYSDFLKDEYEIGFAAHWEATAGATIGTTAILTARGFVMEGPPHTFTDENKRTIKHRTPACRSHDSAVRACR